jgi:hypothetical protein
VSNSGNIILISGKTPARPKWLTVREYRLTYHQMVYWCSKRDGLSKHDEPTSGFVPVSVSSPVTSGSSQLSVRLPSGISIEGINELTLNMVAQLVRSL